MAARYRYFVFALCFACMAYGCKGQVKQTAPAHAIPADTVIKGNFNTSLNVTFDSTAVDTFLKQQPAFAGFAEDMKAFYRLHKFTYVWYNGAGLTEAAHNLVNHLETQQADGILKSIPYKDVFLKLINNVRADDMQKPLTEVELMLTAQYFNYAHNKWGGAEADKTTKMGWYLPKKKLSYTQLLQKQLAGNTDSVEQLAVIPQYLALRKALNTYQQLEQKEQDVVVAYTAAAAKLKPGDTSAIIPLLRERLRQLGDLQTIAPGNRYDDSLQTAVLRFKERHGLTLNATLTATFFRQLNVPLRKRIEMMIVNLERMRWIPVDDHGGEYILVNIPEYKLHYYTDNKLVWGCKVVVGKVMNKTVIFSGHMAYIVFSPYWYVPPSIINKEIKPGMARNPNYLADHRMEWNGGNVRQKPGKSNSLGLVKFIFPNSNNIYLHDTPAKPLFNEDNRAFSHGCVRVEKPRELAIRILKQNPAWTPEKIDAAMNAGTERTVVLKQKIPVYMGYFTAFVNSKGLLNFRNDIYNRDAELLDMLMER